MYDLATAQQRVNSRAQQRYGRAPTADEWNRIGARFQGRTGDFTDADIDLANSEVDAIAASYGPPPTSHTTPPPIPPPPGVGYAPSPPQNPGGDLIPPPGGVGMWRSDDPNQQGGAGGADRRDWSQVDRRPRSGYSLGEIPDAPPFTAPRLSLNRMGTPPELSLNRMSPGPALALDRMPEREKFSYKTFQAPTVADLQADPSYQFRRDQGLGAIEASAAAGGMTLTGRTLKGLQEYGDNLASQEYAGLYDRRFNEWATGYDTEANTYMTNYGVDRDRFEADRSADLAEFETGYRGRRDEYESDRSADLAEYDSRYRGFRDVHDDERMADLAEYESEFRGREAEYDPSMQTWMARVNAGQRAAELELEQGWRQQLYDRDSTYRSERDRIADERTRRDEDFRRQAYDRDDAWRRYVLEEERRRYLADAGRF